MKQILLIVMLLVSLKVSARELTGKVQLVCQNQGSPVIYEAADEIQLFPGDQIHLMAWSRDKQGYRLRLKLKASNCKIEAQREQQDPR